MYFFPVVQPHLPFISIAVIGSGHPVHLYHPFYITEKYRAIFRLLRDIFR